MKSRTFVIGAVALFLGGCDLIRVMLPRHETTAAEARSALIRCGIVPESIAWSVTAEGTFAFGRKSADSMPMPGPQSACLMRWVEINRVKVAFIGWETGPR
ncbi:hypothetical protein [Sphingomonas panacis]|uniref:hypothetical protein n=1 Tax=Sphingomonas panacis TaxID=1560345 RepID=UPI00147188F5|nr:hypothetical protein [Sphingomonas panacis]